MLPEDRAGVSPTSLTAVLAMHLSYEETHRVFLGLSVSTRQPEEMDQKLNKKSLLHPSPPSNVQPDHETKLGESSSTWLSDFGVTLKD